MKTTIIVIILSVILVFAGIKAIDARKEVIGHQDYELIEHIRTLPAPKYLLYLHIPKCDGCGYYANPDMFIFSTAIINPETNPKKIQQIAQYIYWRDIDVDGLMEFINQVSLQIPTYIIVPKYGSQNAPEEIDELLSDYSKTELKWYNIYQIMEGSK